MEREIARPSESYKKLMRSNKEKSDTFTRDMVESHRRYYDEMFIKNVEGAESLAKLEGLEDIVNMLLECVPDHYLEWFRKEWEAYRTEKEKTDKREPVKSEEYINDLVDQMGRRTYLFSGSYDSAFVDNFYKLVTVEKEKYRQVWAICSYYFFSIDNGYKRIAKMLPRLLLDNDNSKATYDIFANLIHGMVTTSMYIGTESKKSWQEFADEDTEGHLWKEINWALLHTVNNQGRKASSISLAGMLVGDKAKLLQLIEKFMAENKEALCMAYLFIALEDAGCIQCDGFSVFLKSLNAYFETAYVYRNAQERYSEIRKHRNNLDKKLASWVKAKRIIEKWTETFRDCA